METNQVAASNTNLESIAAEIVAATGCSIQEARAAVRIEMTRFAVAFGTITLEQGNARLADAGLTMRRAS